MRTSKLIVAAVLGLALPAPQALAADIFSEVRLGPLAHDVKALGGKEHGTDINGELLFTSPVPESFVEPMPEWLHWLLQPRPTIGASLNTDSYTSQYYAGLTWTIVPVRHLFTAQDAVFVDYDFGPAINNGHTATDAPDRKQLGGHILFHLAADIGYQITPRWSAMVYFEHSSNGDLVPHNQSLNNVGLRIGLKF